jgi:alpha-tubulin suppressor-like RCC1 family protein
MITSSNTLVCWGSNSFGQAGVATGTNSQMSAPLFVSTPTVVSQFVSGTLLSVAAGDLHTCVVISGVVYCVGDNQSGQLGTSPATTPYSLNPIQVPGISNVVSVAVGTQFSCALLSSGNVQCWGTNSSGQLGNKTFTSSSIPVSVLTAPNSPLTGVTQISAKGSQVCGLVSQSSGNQIYCWGYNYYGQLGNNSTANSNLAVLVSGLGTAQVSPSAVSVGTDHACALLNNGQVQCWGYNFFGQLGNGQFGLEANSLVPVYVNNLNSATAVVAGGDHTCAIENGGQVVCWGENNAGQLGLGSVQDNSEPQEPVANVSGVVSLSAGGAYTCAMSSSQLWCWGSNTSDQLGNGATPYSLAAVPDFC